MRALADWHRQYHGTQDSVETRDRVLVYPEHDHAIPFRPEEDIVYAYMVGQLAYVAGELSEIVSRKQMWSITGGFVDMNRISQEAFSRTPTMTPRYLHHARLTLRVVSRSKTASITPSTTSS